MPSGRSRFVSQSNRLIATGWDSPNAARFRAELAAFEQWGVFDGTTIAPTRRLADGRVVDSRKAFSSDHWDWAEFADCVRDLQAAQPKQATNNFLMIYANPGNVDWFDDAGWGEVVDHWRLLARVAKQGNLIDGVVRKAETISVQRMPQRHHGSGGAPRLGNGCLRRGSGAKDVKDPDMAEGDGETDDNAACRRRSINTIRFLPKGVYLIEERCVWARTRVCWHDRGACLFARPDDWQPTLQAPMIETVDAADAARISPVSGCRLRRGTPNAGRKSGDVRPPDRGRSASRSMSAPILARRLAPEPTAICSACTGAGANAGTFCRCSRQRVLRRRAPVRPGDGQR